MQNFNFKPRRKAAKYIVFGNVCVQRRIKDKGDIFDAGIPEFRPPPPLGLIIFINSQYIRIFNFLLTHK